MAEVDELNFFFEQYKPQNEEERNLIKGVRQKFEYFSLAGLFLGGSLAMSMRRYTLPSKSFPIIKLLVGCALPLCGYAFCLKKSVSISIQNLTVFRKKLLENDDELYYEYLAKKYRKYKPIYKSDFDLFSEILTMEEFNNIKNDSRKKFLNLFSPDIDEMFYMRET